MPFRLLADIFYGRRAFLVDALCDDELYVSLTPKVRDYNYLSYIFKADFDGEKFKEVSLILQNTANKKASRRRLYITK